MTSLVLGSAGAAIGFFATGGNLLGAQVGWAIGAGVGAYVSAPDTSGPRLLDRAVQGANYGAPLPLVYGAERLAGTLIWSTDLIETANTTSAKGGPEVTTYSYSVSCAIALAQGPQVGIRRIWADAKLVYDAREDSDPATQASSAAFAEYLTFYPGNESQLPAPTIEAVEGAGTVEPYRGTCYVVFTGLPLGDYGNRIPSFSFELTTEQDQTTTTEELVPYEVARWLLVDSVPGHGGPAAVYDDLTLYESGVTVIGGTHASFADAFEQARIELAVDEAYVIAWSNSINGLPYLFDGGTSIDDDAEYIYVYVGINEVKHVIDISVAGSTGQRVTRSMAAYGLAVEKPEDYGQALSACLMREQWEVDGAPGGFLQFGVCRLVYSTSAEAPPAGYYAIYQATEYEPVYPGPFPNLFPTAVASPTVRIRIKRTPYIPAQTCSVGDPSLLGIAQLPDNPAVCIASDGEISRNFTYSNENGTFKQLAKITYTSGALTANGVGPVLRSSDANYSSSSYWTAAATAAGIDGTYGVDYPVTVTSVGTGELDVSSVTAGSVLLSDVVSDLCARAGLAGAEYDVADLASDTVSGYLVGRMSTARQAIDSLRAVYQFDAVESGSEIRFVKRGGASVATLSDDDLGAARDGSVEPIETERRQESEIPSAVVVAYQAFDADYQMGSQQARRAVGASDQAMNVELSLVMSDDEAANIAELILYQSWAERVRRKFSLPVKYAYLEPSDVVTVLDYDGRSRRVRIVDKTEADGVLDFEALEDASPYTPNATAGSTTSSATTSGMSFVGLTNLQPMDLPLLREVDNAASTGYYLAASGYGPGWPGGRAFSSIDAGASYSSLLDVRQVATIGRADTTLQDFGGGYVVDECSAVDVTLNAGTLSSVTRAQLFAGANLCAIGDEVICFQRASLVSGSTYRLTGLMRGLFGTEQHIGTHAAGDRFVLLLTDTTYRVPSGLAQIGVDLVLKGVTFGSTLAGSLAVDFTNTGAGAKPLSVVQLSAAAGDGSPAQYIATWTRRSRIPHQWSDYIDAPLGEVSERYLVEVLRGGAVIGAQTVTSETATVDAAVGDVLRVRQLSDLVGPGFPATITIT